MDIPAGGTTTGIAATGTESSRASGAVRPTPGPRLVPPHAFGAGSSILNLAAGIAGRFGVPTAVPPVDDARFAAALQAARSVVTVLFDGLGERQLATHAPHGALSRHRLRSLDSVFPSSTAPAMTSLATAAPPAMHGNPAWLMWSESAAAIVRTLPMDVRGDHGRTVSAADTWSWRPWAAQASVPTLAILPREIADSEFSRHAYSGSTRLAYAQIDEIPDKVVETLRAYPDGVSVFVYLPQFDAVSHHAGWQSDAAAAVVREFDRWFATLVERCAPFDALLLASADHGFVDIDAADRLQLRDFPSIGECLERPLSGEPRVPFCQVRPEHRKRFAQVVASALGDAFDVHESARLLRAGWFGAAAPGRTSALAGRLGTHLLVPRRLVTLVDAVEGERSMRFIGMHGGTSDDEMRVPLVAVHRGRPIA